MTGLWFPARHGDTPSSLDGFCERENPTKVDDGLGGTRFFKKTPGIFLGDWSENRGSTPKNDRQCTWKMINKHRNDE